MEVITEEQLESLKGSRGAWIPADLSEEQFSSYEQGADSGDRDAQFYLAVCYQYGLGVVKNITKALQAARGAAKQGSAAAACLVGQFLQSDDPEDALKWYDVAQSRGDLRAPALKSWCYLNGVGVREDREEGVQLAQLSANGEDPHGMYVLATCYLSGRGVEVDKEKGMALLRNAAMKGHSRALNDLGQCYDKGKEVPQRIDLALKVFEVAAELGNSTAQAELGYRFLTGTNVEKNVERGKTLLHQAASTGNNRLAQEHLGDHWQAENNIREANHWYTKAAELGSSYGKDQLVHNYSRSRGDSLPVNKTETVRVCRQLLRADSKDRQSVEEDLNAVIDRHLVSKLAVIGMSCSGKTSLVTSIEQALSGNFSRVMIPRGERTAGIAISKLSLSRSQDSTDSGIEDEGTPVMVMDLAGHKEWRMSHEYFVQFEGGVFVLLCDLSRDPSEQSAHVEFWLRFVNSLALRKKSENRSKVIIVGSHADEATDPTMATPINTLVQDRHEPTTQKFQSEWGNDIVATMSHRFENYIDITPEFYCLDCRNPASDAVMAIKTLMQTYRLHSIANCHNHLQRGEEHMKLEQYYSVIENLQQKLHHCHLGLVRVSLFAEEASALGYKWAQGDALRHCLKYVDLLGLAHFFPDSGWLITDPKWFAQDVLERVLGPKVWQRPTLQSFVARGRIKISTFEDRMLDIIHNRTTIEDIIEVLKDLDLCYPLPRDPTDDSDAEPALMFHTLLREARPGTSWEIDAASYNNYEGCRLTCRNRNCILMPSVLPRVQLHVSQSLCPDAPDRTIVLWCDALLFVIEGDDYMFQALVHADELMHYVDVVVRWSGPIEDDGITPTDILESLRKIVKSKWMTSKTDITPLNPAALQRGLFVPQPLNDAAQAVAVPGLQPSNPNSEVSVHLNDVMKFLKDQKWQKRTRDFFVTSTEPYSISRDNPASILDRLPFHISTVSFLEQNPCTVTYIKSKCVTKAFEGSSEALSIEFNRSQHPEHFLCPQWELDVFIPFGEVEFHQTLAARQWRHAVVNHIFSSYPGIANDMWGVRVQPVFIGVENREVAEKICSAGFPCKHTRDAGYFGHGTYCTTDIEYAYFYANGCSSNFHPDRQPAIIVALAAIGNPLPIIEHPSKPTDGVTTNLQHVSTSFYGRAQQGGYDSHLITVRRKFVPRQQLLTPIPPREWHKDGVWSEIVMMDKRCILPLAILEFSKYVRLPWVYSAHHQSGHVGS